MRAILQNPVWKRAQADRGRQKLIGRLSAFFLAIALFALFDGLQASMRQGPGELDLLPGQSLAISGPCAIKNPVASDLSAQMAPKGAPLQFELEGFFSGYWFGSGMWRGILRALPDAQPGRYFLRVFFRGAPGQNAQQYSLNIYADRQAMRTASLAFIQRGFGINPFVLAAWAGGLGFLCGAATYWFGRRYAEALRELGLAQVYAHDAATATIICMAPRELAPPAGNSRMVLAADGKVTGEAQAIDWQKGRLKLKLLDETAPPPDALVCLKHPEMPS